MPPLCYAGSAASTASGAAGSGVGGAIALLGMVQFSAMSAQANTPLPKSYTAFNGNFAWANLQLDFGFLKSLASCVAGQVRNGDELGDAESADYVNAIRCTRHSSPRRTTPGRVMSLGMKGCLRPCVQRHSYAIHICTAPDELRPAPTAERPSCSPRSAKASGKVDGTLVFLAEKGVSAGQNYVGNLFSVVLIMAFLGTAHAGLTLYLGKESMVGLLAFPKVELIIFTTFFQGVSARKTTGHFA